MLDSWMRFQNAVWWRRAPVKAVVLGVTVFLVCFPYPKLFVRHVLRWSDPNVLIEPDAAELLPLLDELRPKLSNIEAGPDALKVVEKFVYEKVPYAWDWDTWGVVDYIPTVPEVMDAGQEDCDGRAVVSASLLRNLGYQADLVTDTTHVWVKTDQGETMSPGKLPKLVEAGEDGVTINWGSLLNIPRNFGYGVAVFPFWREMTIVLVFWGLALRTGIGRVGPAVCLLLMLNGLVLLRYASANPWHDAPADVAAEWFALANLAAGVVMSQVMQRRARRSGAVTALNADRLGDARRNK